MKYPLRQRTLLSKQPANSMSNFNSSGRRTDLVVNYLKRVSGLCKLYYLLNKIPARMAVRPFKTDYTESAAAFNQQFFTR